jgi:hypothetical protein
MPISVSFIHMQTIVKTHQWNWNVASGLHCRRGECCEGNRIPLVIINDYGLFFIFKLQLFTGGLKFLNSTENNLVLHCFIELILPIYSLRPVRYFCRIQYCTAALLIMDLFYSNSTIILDPVKTRTTQKLVVPKMVHFLCVCLYCIKLPAHKIAYRRAILTNRNCFNQHQNFS